MSPAIGYRNLDAWTVSMELMELDTQVELARRLRFVSADATHEFDADLDGVRQMLYGMRREHDNRLITASASVTSLLVALFTAARVFA